MEITFLGAAENVTGSRALLETGNSRILIDCGLFQERDLRLRNWEPFPVKPSTIDSVILTHAHIDHCGYLPRLVREGFNGKIFSTSPTSAIAEIALLDSAKLQEEDAKFKKKRHGKERREGPYPVVPLYTEDDAANVLPLFESTSYKKPLRISSDVEVTFHDAGHILGAAMLELKIRQDGQAKTCIFSGDIGRWEKPILCDPTVFEQADYVFMESTYGNRLHREKEVPLEKLRRIIVETNQAGGNVIIPTFAIERAQELLYHISELLRENKIPPLTVFVNSPMAINVTEVFKKYSNYFDREAKALLESGDSPFNFPLLKLTRSVEESKAIHSVTSPSIIMAGSGMCTGGRIKYHLEHNISRPESTILFAGYQAKGTLGREILERPKKVRILGRIHPVQARIEKINGFSAHADKDELLRWVSAFKVCPQKIFVIHGEQEISESFASTLRKKFDSTTIVPKYLEKHSL